jgi:hypothetical protein
MFSSPSAVSCAGLEVFALILIATYRSLSHFHLWTNQTSEERGKVVGTRLCKISRKPDCRAASMTKFRGQLVPVVQNVADTCWIKITCTIVRRIFLFHELQRVYSRGNR